MLVRAAAGRREVRKSSHVPSLGDSWLDLRVLTSVHVGMNEAVSLCPIALARIGKAAAIGFGSVPKHTTRAILVYQYRGIWLRVISCGIS